MPNKLYVHDKGHPEPNRHNYFAKLQKLITEGKISGVKDVDIFHDDWCAIYDGGYCNCDPDIKIRKAG